MDSFRWQSDRGALVNPHNRLHNFISLVSAFSHEKQQILALGKLENKKESQIRVVKNLIKMLDLQGVVFSLDALDCQKATVKQIVEHGNEYVIGVKANQKHLWRQIKKTSK